jgi:CxxC motif-containing protein
MREQTITCIVCPNSCRIRVKEDGLDISGYQCKRGLEHARNEIGNPMRMLTATVAVTGAAFKLLPVISSAEVPRKMLRSCLRAIYGLRVQAPVRAGSVILSNVCGTGADILAARTMKKLT